VAVPTYGLTMDAGDLRWLRKHHGTYRWFPACLRVESESLPVWIGYRGRYSRWFPKPSYDICFDEGQLFHGHARLHLNAAYKDPSLMRGRLSLQLFTDLGVPTPCSWHVCLVINGEPVGLYTAIEALDKEWFARRGLTAGAIYYAVGSKGNFGLLDPDTGKRKRDLATGYEKCFPWDDDFSDLEALLYAITLPEPSQFEQEIAHRLDIENCLRWLVGLEFMSHTDGLIQNYSLFRCREGLWQISPWDCDGTWGRTPRGRIILADDMSVGTGEENYLLARLMMAPRWRKRYHSIWEETLREVLSAEHISTRIDEILREIRPAALQDSRKRYGNTTFLREPSRLRRYMVERTAFVSRRLQG
jgi:spore coat protein H